jgi:hypothetical protein
VYDVIVAVYPSESDERQLYGYQLKEGRGSPKELKKTVKSKFIGSLVIRGEPNKAKSTQRKGVSWIVPGKKEIDSFFGVSGRSWTPQAWDNLLGEGGGREEVTD